MKRVKILFSLALSVQGLGFRFRVEGWFGEPVDQGPGIPGGGGGGVRAHNQNWALKSFGT